MRHNAPLGITAGLTFALAATPSSAQIAPPPPGPSASYWRPVPIQAALDGEFTLIRRERVAALDVEFDAANLSIPEDEVHLLLPRGAIPALFNPVTEPLSVAREWLGDSRVVVVDLREHPEADPDAGPGVVLVPLRVLNFHEVVNLDVAGVPVAVTYAPLSDCVAVFDRRVPVVVGDGSTIDEVVDLEVSGALIDANILMYDRNTRGLWSQMRGRSVGGLFAGTRLRPLDLHVVPASSLGPEFDTVPTVNRDTGADRDYTRDAYIEFIEGPSLLVEVKDPGTELPTKTLGMVVNDHTSDEAGENTRSFFVPRGVVTEAGGMVVLRTPSGARVRIENTGTDDGRGMRAVVVSRSNGSAPDEAGPLVCTALYFAWSGMFPEGEVVRAGSAVLTDSEP